MGIQSYFAAPPSRDGRLGTSLSSFNCLGNGRFAIFASVNAEIDVDQ